MHSTEYGCMRHHAINLGATFVAVQVHIAFDCSWRLIDQNESLFEASVGGYLLYEDMQLQHVKLLIVLSSKYNSSRKCTTRCTNTYFLYVCEMFTTVICCRQCTMSGRRIVAL